MYLQRNYERQLSRSLGKIGIASPVKALKITENGVYIESEFQKGKINGNVLLIKKDGVHFEGYVRKGGWFSGVSTPISYEQKGKDGGVSMYGSQYKPHKILLTGKNKIGFEYKIGDRAFKSRYSSRSKEGSSGKVRVRR